MTEVMRAADGTPLKRSLARALRRQKLRAVLLIAPLLLFILISFLMPIGKMLARSVQNGLVVETIPRTVGALDATGYDAASGQPPDEAVFSAFYLDLSVAEEFKSHTRLGSRLNYEQSGMSSLFRSIGRELRDMGTGAYTEAFAAADPAFADPPTFAGWMAQEPVQEALPRTADAWAEWVRVLETAGRNPKNPAEEDPADWVYTALYEDYAAGAAPPGLPMVDVSSWPRVSLRDGFAAADAAWVAPETWRVIQNFSPRITDGYFLNAADLMRGADGVERRPANERLYLMLFARTLWMSLVITFSCILLGYPVAWLLANSSDRRANLMMILVLLPFWTSLLVRTSAWKVLLQQQGVINDVLVWAHVISDEGRLIMINNATGTIIAMTHILLPFMILPLYSVMKTIPPSYLRAAKSLGATDWTAFRRVYFPQSVPGIGAGSILVFILAIGYYITPELVGGTKGVFISNRIAYHISQSLNWGLAAALGTMLLLVVLVFFWIYDRWVGIDNVKLGG